jgi:hypothetical protein
MDMESRVSKLERDLSAMKIDIADIKANGATREDIHECKRELKVDLAEGKGALGTKLAEGKGDLEAKLGQIQGELEAKLAEFKGQLAVQLADAKGELKADIAEAKASIIMWVVTAIFIAQLLPLIKDYLKESRQPAPAAVTRTVAPTTPLPAEVRLSASQETSATQHRDPRH